MTKEPCSDNDVQPSLSKSACAAEVRAEGINRGLASIAGGWNGSDELVRILDESLRTGAREVQLP